MCCIHNGCAQISYQAARDAMEGRAYRMSLTDRDEIRAVIAAVNQGIDSHLEACFLPARGDRYAHAHRKAGQLIVCPCLDCTVSLQSLPVLLRRLCELDAEDIADAGLSLAGDILLTLGFDESGQFVGREALGLV
jgi:hypothetical protein